MASTDSPLPITPASDNNAQQSEKQLPATSNVTDEDEGAEAIRKVEEATTPSKDAQQGVRSVEAVTLTWTKTSLVIAFIL